MTTETPLYKSDLKPHTPIEVEGFTTALDAWLLAKLAHLGLVKAPAAISVEKATKQLMSYVQPLLCFDE